MRSGLSGDSIQPRGSFFSRAVSPRSYSLYPRLKTAVDALNRTSSNIGASLIGLTVIRQPKRRILPAGLGWGLIAFRPVVVVDGEFMAPKVFLAKAAFGFASQWFRWPGAANVMTWRNHLLTGNLWRRPRGIKRQIAGFCRAVAGQITSGLSKARIGSATGRIPSDGARRW